MKKAENLFLVDLGDLRLPGLEVAAKARWLGRGCQVIQRGLSAICIQDIIIIFLYLVYLIVIAWSPGFCQSICIAPFKNFCMVFDGTAKEIPAA